MRTQNWKRIINCQRKEIKVLIQRHYYLKAKYRKKSKKSTTPQGPKNTAGQRKVNHIALCSVHMYTKWSFRSLTHVVSYVLFRSNIVECVKC